MAKIISKKANSIKGNVKIPGDKSISHRALILSSQTIGTTKISGLLESEDVINTAKALQNLGVKISKKKSQWIVQGVGIGGLRKPAKNLDMGNSGTGSRLMMGLMASYPFTTTFIGDKSLSKRPMARVTIPLEKMGAEFKSKDGKLPLSVIGHNDMFPITYESPVASAQVKSAVLLAGLNIPGKTTVIEPEPTRDHTELMLKYLGAEVEVKGNKVTLTGQPELSARDINVPSDPSSAAFLVAAALITKNSSIIVKNICINPHRIGFYTTLREMGAKIEFKNRRTEAGEKIADIKASTSNLRGVNVPAARAPSMIDEYPILAVVAAFAKGKTRMNGLSELRVKESDRLAAIEAGLKVNGVKVKSGQDWLEVTGGTVKGGGKVKTHMDHRIAMSFIVMGAASEKPVTVDDDSMIATSFPEFKGLFRKIGGKI